MRGAGAPEDKAAEESTGGGFLGSHSSWGRPLRRKSVAPKRQSMRLNGVPDPHVVADETLSADCQALPTATQRPAKSPVTKCGRPA